MKRMLVITPSFAPYFELCADLHLSVLEYWRVCDVSNPRCPSSRMSVAGRNR